MPFALITGGSAGLGAAFADRLAASGHDLLLVARRTEQLSITARDVADRHGVRADVLAADLADRRGLARVEALLSDADAPDVDVLVNNAACESGAPFPDADRGRVQTEIDLNVTATMRLTHAVLPGMLARGTGTVVNVGSIAGWLPSAGSTYGPTKAWVAAFTDSLASVLNGTGVRAVALCPGYMRTGWNGREEPTGPAAVLWAEPERVVDTCLADLERGRVVSVPGPVFRPLVGLLEMPRRMLRLLARAAGASREARYARRGQQTPAPPEPPAAPSERVGSSAQHEGHEPSSAGAPPRPALPDLPARPAQRSARLPHPTPSPHFVPTSRPTADARARARLERPCRDAAVPAQQRGA